MKIKKTLITLCAAAVMIPEAVQAADVNDGPDNPLLQKSTKKQIICQPLNMASSRTERR